MSTPARLKGGLSSDTRLASYMQRIAAALLSGVCPGLGQIYSGRQRAALTFLVAVALLTNFYSIVFTYVAPIHFWIVAIPIIGALLGLAVWIVGVFHALIARPLRGARPAMPLEDLGKLAAFFSVGWTAMLAADIVSGLLKRDHIIDYRSVSREGSMLPSIAPGEFIAIWRNYYSVHDPKRGEVVVFFRPAGDWFIKRILGTPGDRIQMRGEDIWINDQLVERDRVGHLEADRHSGQLYREHLPGGATYIVLQRNHHASQPRADEFLVPAEHYFVLGDNRHASFDSRDGRLMSGIDRAPENIDHFVPRERLVGRPTLVLYSSTPSRFGAVIQPKIDGHEARP